MRARARGDDCGAGGEWTRRRRREHSCTTKAGGGERLAAAGAEDDAGTSGKGAACGGAAECVQCRGGSRAPASSGGSRGERRRGRASLAVQGSGSVLEEEDEDGASDEVTARRRCRGSSSPTRSLSAAARSSGNAGQQLRWKAVVSAGTGKSPSLIGQSSGGVCGYSNLYDQGYGVDNVALSMELFDDDASCGQCYLIICNTSKTWWCKPGTAVTVSATNLCPPNWALPGHNGGWCNTPRQHFDMSQPAWEKIAIYRAGIVPVLYQRVKCWRQGGSRFTVAGFNYFQLVLITNVAGSGSVAMASIKGSNTGWIQMSRNWGANWQCLSGLAGQALSFAVTTTGGQYLLFENVVPAWWKFGQTFTTYKQFDY
ncbi:expansin-A31-like [Triticum dicoccoides]|uniref:expansin-A31-like n=1 Tax=Triticum dicoccoides TaxID=85692 RepID=UPI00188F2B7D|nr:expansin-A31-like [Triticum dicoccoides]